MDNDFLSLLKSSHSLSAIEETVLLSVGVRKPEELVSLVQAFPVLGEIGLDLAKLSSVGLQYSSQTFAAAVSQNGVASGKPPNFPFGAEPPPYASGMVGTTVPMPSTVSPPPVSSAGPPTAPASIDLRSTNWPVRHQGERGTCVAFALVACREHLEMEGALPLSQTLSEQYLYWAAKGCDPWPAVDGTGIGYAKKALERLGTCLSSLWPYDGGLQSAIVGSNNHLTHATAAQPSQAAHADASTRKHGAGHYTAHYNSGVTAKKSAALLNLLQTKRRPVAIAVPVFGDPVARLAGATSNNWNTGLAVVYGSILNPPPGSVATSGHAVCVTGFLLDASEPSGGYFIFRNSWGKDLFAYAAPAPGYHSPEPGYGQISATYIDNYLWEMCGL